MPQSSLLPFAVSRKSGPLRPVAVVVAMFVCARSWAVEPVGPSRSVPALSPAPVASPRLAPFSSAAPSADAVASDPDRIEADASNEAHLRRREGSEMIDGIGRFARPGDRAGFLTGDRPTALIVLENLALERVMRVTEEDGLGPIRWRVSGTITEFRGANYLIIRRAVVKSDDASPPVTPDGWDN